MLLGEWAEEAACRGLTSLMAMPPAGRARQSEITIAKQVCENCPVLFDCQDWVLGLKPDPTPQMVTGGLTPEERSHIRRSGLSYAAVDVRLGA